MLIKKNKIPVVEMVLIGFLPSFLKVLIYKFKGYKIGKNVSIGLGSVIIGENVIIGDNTKIGFISVIRARTIHIARYVTIGSLTMIDTGDLSIDEDARINENVIVGGTKTPQSMLKIGKRVIIMEYAFINTTMPIHIGDDSGIGGHCLLFTHGSWLNQLDGFPVTFAPITIGKKVWLPWRVFIMPGVTIGDEVVIGANSLISSNLPSNVMAAGTPAKILKENYPAKITSDKRNDILVSIINEFAGYLNYNNIVNSLTIIDGVYTLEVIKNKKQMYLVYIHDLKNEYAPPAHIDTLVVDYPSKSADIKAKMILNLHDKTRIGSTDLGEEFSKYLSRHGIRFDRLD